MTHRFPFVAGAALLILAIAASPAVARGPAGAPTAPTVRELSGTFHGATVAFRADTGAVRMIGGTAARPAATRAELGGPATAAAAANAFLARTATLFGISDAQQDLQVASTQAATGQRTVIRYRQLYRGIPVMAGDLVVDVSHKLDVISANGEASPQLAISTQPAVSAASARSTALASIASAHATAPSALSASTPQLWIYDSRLLGVPGIPVTGLAWRLDVTAGSPKDMDELVLVDALKGGVMLHFNQIETAAPAASRIVCDRHNAVLALATCGTAGEPIVIQSDTTGYSTASADAQRAFDYSGATWAYYFNRFGRDSLDGAGLQLKSTVRYCPPSAACPYPNAFWNGTQMTYGAGYAAADDVDGHELTHGFTEFTSGLVYLYQSGAINEALSDIMGEFIDQDFHGAYDNDTPGVKWLLGEDIPGLSATGVRNMQDPTTSHQGPQPDMMTSPYYFAASSPYADNGGVHHNSGVANKSAYLLGEDPAGGPIHFNNVNVTPIGRDKAAAIFYEVDANLLTSGSDYADLGTDMQQACQNLLGTTPNDGTGAVSASGAFTAADCTQVGNAVTATEMELQPTVAGAAAPEAPVCPAAKPHAVTVFSQNGEYTQAQVDAGVPWVMTGGSHWFLDNAYATSVDKNAAVHDFYGEDYGTSSPSSANVTDTSLAMKNAVSIPAGAYLRFNHSYVFDYGAEYGPPTSDNYDAGVVEYSINGGSWTDLGPKFTDNGYTGTVASGYGNPLQGKQAFTGSSNGYISSRASLSSLSGKSVKLRWRIGTNNQWGDIGWYLDDISIYSCADVTGPTVGAPKADLAKGTLGTNATPVPLKVSFTATDPSGLAHTGLKHKYGAGAFGAVTLPSATALSATLNVAASETNTHQFQASATDIAQNATIGSPSTLHVRIRQNTATTAQGLTYTGSWSSQSKASFSGGSVKFASASGRRASLTLSNVTDFAWVTTKGKDRGKADVYVDGVKKATVDLYSALTKYRQIVFTWAGTAGTHTIQIRVLGTKNAKATGKRVDLDALLALTQ